MSMTDRERQLAKQAAAKLLRHMNPALSEEDRGLLKKYPKHSIEQAREIEATLPPVPKQHPDQDLGFVSGFDRLIAQERGNFHLSGDHT